MSGVGLPIKQIARIAIISTIAAIGAVIYFEERSAIQGGFGSSSQRAAATNAGFDNSAAWKAKLEADAKEAERKHREEIEIEMKRRRSANVEAIRIFAKAPISTNVKFDTPERANAMRDIWRDLEGAIHQIMIDAPSNEELRLIESARAKLRSMKTTVYPLLRKGFEKFAGEMLWVEDYKIFVSGNRSEQVLLVHHGFVLNRNIKKGVETLSNTLGDFRFQRACFSSSQSTYAERTCYSLNNPSDEK